MSGAVAEIIEDNFYTHALPLLRSRHKHDTVVRWPAQAPTHGIKDHRAEGVQQFKTFPDQKIENRPYKLFFAQGDWTCSIARFTGTMTGPMVVGGKTIPPTIPPMRRWMLLSVVACSSSSSREGRFEDHTPGLHRRAARGDSALS